MGIPEKACWLCGLSHFIHLTKKEFIVFMNESQTRVFRCCSMYTSMLCSLYITIDSCVDMLCNLPAVVKLVLPSVLYFFEFSCSFHVRLHHSVGLRGTIRSPRRVRVGAGL